MQTFASTPRATLISRNEHPGRDAPGRLASPTPSDLHVPAHVKTHHLPVVVETAPVDDGLQAPSPRFTPDDWARALIEELNRATTPRVHFDIPRLFRYHANVLNRIRKEQPDASVSQEVLDEVDTEIMANLSCWFRAGHAQSSCEPGNRSQSNWIDALVSINRAWSGLPIRGGEPGSKTGSIVYRPEGYMAQHLPVIEPPKPSPLLPPSDEPGDQRLCRWLDVYSRGCKPTVRLALSAVLEVFLREIDEADESIYELLEPLRSGLDAPSSGGYRAVDFSLNLFKTAVAEAFPGRDFSDYWSSPESNCFWN